MFSTVLHLLATIMLYLFRCPHPVVYSPSLLQVTIMFADIVGFTNMCHALPPDDIMAFLNELYSAFDKLVDIYNVYKVRLLPVQLHVRGKFIKRTTKLDSASDCG